jgi:hypothetical protein
VRNLAASDSGVVSSVGAGEESSASTSACGGGPIMATSLPLSVTRLHSPLAAARTSADRWALACQTPRDFIGSLLDTNSCCTEVPGAGRLRAEPVVAPLGSGRRSGATSVARGIGGARDHTATGAKWAHGVTAAAAGRPPLVDNGGRCGAAPVGSAKERGAGQNGCSGCSTTADKSIVH